VAALSFDVILPTIWRDSLFEAIDSVRSQTFENWRLYVVADLPLVNGEALIEAIDRIGDPRISPCTVNSNLINNFSGTAARNLAIDVGTSPWIAYIDDDDKWLPRHLDVFASLIKNDINLLHSRGCVVKYGHKHPRSSEKVRKTIGYCDDKTCVGMAHTRELFNKTRGWQPIDNHDHLLWADMMAAGGNPAITTEVTYEFLR
jgi:glycosyltransferase involved in cell wall biosynthesis